MSKDEDAHLKETLDSGDIAGAVTEASKENADIIKEAKSAAEEDDDEGIVGDFEVTKEEMSIIRAELACEFPEDYTYMRWVVIVCVGCRESSEFVLGVRVGATML